MGVWGVHAAAAFVGGLVLIGVGFLLFYLDCAIALIRRYGSRAGCPITYDHNLSCPRRPHACRQGHKAPAGERAHE